jgi:hypothetical protein
VDETGSRSCSMVSFDISDIELSCSATVVLVHTSV